MRLTKNIENKNRWNKETNELSNLKKLLNEFNENTANADITKVEIVVDIDEF